MTARQDDDYWETVAIQAVSFLLADEKTRGGFLGATGLGAAELKAGLGDREFLSGVLAYLLGREDLLIEFCDAEGHDRSLPQKAYRALSGGGIPSNG